MDKEKKFDRSYLEMASVWAKNSYCSRRQVGAILLIHGLGVRPVDDNQSQINIRQFFRSRPDYVIRCI